jgi:glucose/arabinose dehydrogenase
MLSAKRLVLFLLLLLLVVALAYRSSELATAVSDVRWVPSVPSPFAVAHWADVPNARSLALSPDGRTLFVGTRADKVYKVTISESNTASAVELFQEGLQGSNGVCFLGEDFYLAQRERVVRFTASGGFPLKVKGEVVLEGLPDATAHGWRYLKASPDGRLVIAIGGPCNACLRLDDQRFASICSFRPDGSDFRVEAHGVRNSVGFDWHPRTGDFYFTDNGRDSLGDDIPPCELNVLPKGTTNQHFGFPYFWGDNQRDTEIEAEPPAADYRPPVVKFQAHVAPLGLHFPRHPRWKGLLDGKALVAQHGSWNRSSPVGYQVVSLDPTSAQAEVQPFMWGFLQQGSDKRLRGRPVDITELADGTLLVSDDDKGKIWAVTPRI